MSEFFSFLTNGRGKAYYFDAKIRKRILSEKWGYDTDSHSSIAKYFRSHGELEDELNEWEYNPLTKELIAHKINTTYDKDFAKKFVKYLDFKTIVPELIIKPIVNPFSPPAKKVTKKDLKNLRKWASIWALVGASIRALGRSVIY